MAFAEKFTYDSLLTKLSNTCAENKLISNVSTERYPIVITVEPDKAADGQTSLFGSDDQGSAAKICYIFAGGRLTYKTYSKFTLPETTFNKLKNLSKKIFNAYNALYFRESKKRDRMIDDSLVPLADDDDTEDIGDSTGNSSSEQ